MNVSLNFGIVALLIGAAFLAIGIFGRSFEAPQFKITAEVNPAARILSIIVGSVFITMGTLLSLQVEQDGKGAIAGESSITAAPSSTATTTPTSSKPSTSLRQLSRASIEAATSSELAPQGATNYRPQNTTDGDPSTAWSEGVGGVGVGEYLSYRFDRSVQLREIHLINGYAKTPGLFQRNARIRVATITTDAGSAPAVFKDIRDIQEIRFRQGQTNFVTITIDSVYPGTRYEDTLLSEIEFYISE